MRVLQVKILKTPHFNPVTRVYLSVKQNGRYSAELKHRIDNKDGVGWDLNLNFKTYLNFKLIIVHILFFYFQVVGKAS